MGWDQLKSILDEQRSEQEAGADPTTCPICDKQVEYDEHGRMHCPFDGIVGG